MVGKSSLDQGEIFNSKVKEPDDELWLIVTSSKLRYKKINEANGKERGLFVKIVVKYIMSVAKISQLYNKFLSKK